MKKQCFMLAITFFVSGLWKGKTSTEKCIFVGKIIFEYNSLDIDTVFFSLIWV